MNNEYESTYVSTPNANFEEKENDLKDKIKKRNIVIIILIIIIILLLLLFGWLYFKNKSNNQVVKGAYVENDGMVTYEIKCNEECKCSDGILISDFEKTWDYQNTINLFTNSLYNDESYIAPGSYGTYNFTVKNGSSVNLKYSINYSEKNEYNLNMKYKLSKNGLYVTDWVTYNELSLIDLSLSSGSSDTYKLEWKWFDSDNDTQVGYIQDVYQLTINITAEQDV